MGDKQNKHWNRYSHCNTNTLSHSISPVTVYKGSSVVILLGYYWLKQASHNLMSFPVIEDLLVGMRSIFQGNGNQQTQLL